MQGTYKPVGQGAEQQVSTDTAGRFTVTSPVLATYTFVSSGAGSCVDKVTASSLAFPYTLVLPPLANATITAISLLAVPARADAVLQAKHGSMTEVVPAELWTDVFAMFGYTANAKVRRTSGVWRVAACSWASLYTLPHTMIGKQASCEGVAVNTVAEKIPKRPNVLAACIHCKLLCWSTHVPVHMYHVCCHVDGS